MVTKIILVLLSAAAVMLVLFRYTNSWAHLLQTYYIKESIKLNGSPDGWDEKWKFNLFRVMVVWFGLMAILGVYVLVFGFSRVH